MMPWPHSRAGRTAASGLAPAMSPIGWRAFIQGDVRRPEDVTNPEGHAEQRFQSRGPTRFLPARTLALGKIHIALPVPDPGGRS